MTIICIDNTKHMFITIGTHYETLDYDDIPIIISGEFIISYWIFNDCNQICRYDREYFITLEEFRNSIIDKIL